MLKSNNGISLLLGGATGAVGRELLKVLDVRDIPIRHLGLYASERSAGEEISVRIREGNTVSRDEYLVNELTRDAFKGFDYAIFSMGSAASKQFASAAQSAGCVVIDNSSAFRMKSDVPLVVPPINAHALKDHPGIIANPNCTTAIFLMAAAPLHARFEITAARIVSQQAVSGAGAEALRQFDKQMREAAVGNAVDPAHYPAFPHLVAHNVLPMIGTADRDGYSNEELKLENESRKILGAPDLRVSATCTRVPVRRAHTVHAYLEFKKPLAMGEVRSLLHCASGLEVVDLPSEQIYPTPLMAEGKDECFVGRIRRDHASQNGIALTVVGDQLRRGAAGNAVEILEHLIRLKHR